MKRMKSLGLAVLGLVMVLGLSACAPSAPTLDASSKVAMQSTSKAILESLPEERKDPFKESLTGLMMLAGLAAIAEQVPQEVAMEKMMAKLDGKTGEEIIALAIELKQEMRK